MAGAIKRCLTEVNGGGMRKKLSDMVPGERGRVFRVDGEIRRRLMDMGIVRGATVELVRRAPLGDPVEISVRGYNLSLRGSEAEKVHVEIYDSSETEMDDTEALRRDGWDVRRDE